jgi:prolyl-tRNA synthetase
VIDAKANEIMKELKAAGIRVKYDNNDNNRPGWKFAEYELKGVPIRLAMGLRDMENNVVELARRDTKEKTVVYANNINMRFIYVILPVIRTLISFLFYHSIT